MTLDLASRKDVLLALVGPARTMPDVSPVDADWQAIDAMAAQHRLRPWLHQRLRKGGIALPVPAPVRTAWQEAYRNGAIGALTAQAALVRLSRAFADSGVPMIALKGARLAFFDYPEASLRPMRDIDILVSPEDLHPALSALARAGAEVPEDRDDAIARAIDGDKHLDPIWLPDCERYLELHHRIAEPGLPCIDTAQMLDAAQIAEVGGVPVAFPSPEHMLGHLVLHAVYNHRFDCGPLALVDIAMMTGRENIDAARFMALAKEGGWLAGARLVIALVEAVMGQTGLGIGQDRVPPGILGEASNLVLQDFDQREQVLLASQSIQAGFVATLMARLRRGLSGQSGEGRLRWLTTRTARTMQQAGNARSRSEASSGASVARWLQQEAR